MKQKILYLISFICLNISCYAQCAMCTKTAQQLGEKPAEGMNSGILYLMAAPFLLAGFIGYKWYINNKAIEKQEEAILKSMNQGTT